MKPSLLWIVHDAGCNPGALAAYWGAQILIQAGWRVVVQPLWPPPGALLSDAWEKVCTPLSSHPRRWSRNAQKELQAVVSRFDWILCDQDFQTELRVLQVVEEHTRVYLLGRQTTPLLSSNRLAYGRFDGILTVSRVAYAQFAQTDVVMPSRLHCLPLLVDWQGENLPADSASGGLTVVTAGIVDALKGLDVVLNALNVLHGQGQSVSLIVLGDGPERARLEVYAQALGLCVQFVPQWSNWASWMARADYLLAPQFDDGLAFDVDAAVSLGVPVIGHALPIIVERAVGQPEALLLADMNVMSVVEALRVRPRRPLMRPPRTGRVQLWIGALTIEP